MKQELIHQDVVWPDDLSPYGSPLAYASLQDPVEQEHTQ